MTTKDVIKAIEEGLSLTLAQGYKPDITRPMDAALRDIKTRPLHNFTPAALLKDFILATTRHLTQERSQQTNATL